MTVTNCTDAGPYVLRDLVIRMYWDDEKEPSVESPLGDFFCCGFGMSCYVVSIPICVNPERGFNCYFPMPFQKKAKITIENQHPNKIEGFFYEFDYLLNPNFLGNFAYFHAQWRRTPITTLQKDYTILDNVFGRGHYIGTYIALTVLERCWWGEGEIKFYLDGDQEYPTICGTGMEDYFGGAWSFGTQLDGNEHLFCTPFMGYPFYSKHICFQNKYFNQDAPTMRGFYRWHIPERINFNETIRITLQQIGLNQDGLFERQDDLSSVAYWYQQEPHHAFSSFPHPKDRWPR